MSDSFAMARIGAWDSKCRLSLVITYSLPLLMPYSVIGDAKWICQYRYSKSEMTRLGLMALRWS